MRKFNYKLEIVIFRNSTWKNWVSWGVPFKGLGVQKGTQTPCWLRPCMVHLTSSNQWWPTWVQSLHYKVGSKEGLCYAFQIKIYQPLHGIILDYSNAWHLNVAGKFKRYFPTHKERSHGGWDWENQIKQFPVFTRPYFQLMWNTPYRVRNLVVSTLCNLPDSDLTFS